jgi:hypothetical protein
MMDIVKRLRHTEEETATIGQELVYLKVPVNPDGPEAADEIELLRRQLAHSVDLGNNFMDEIERLRGVLQQIADAKISGVIGDGYNISGWLIKHHTILVDKARAALGEDKHDHIPS